MSSYLDLEERSLDKSSAIIQQLTDQGKRLEYGLAHLPAKLPGAKKQQDAAILPVLQSKGNEKQKQGTEKTKETSAKSSLSRRKSMKSKKKKRIQVPSLSYVRQDEFDSLASYLIGR